MIEQYTNYNNIQNYVQITYVHFQFHFNTLFTATHVLLDSDFKAWHHYFTHADPILCWVQSPNGSFCHTAAYFPFCREKLAYITTVNMQVPVLPSETSEDVSQVEDLLKDGRMGHQV